jgi:hypothetical protein
MGRLGWLRAFRSIHGGIEVPRDCVATHTAAEVLPDRQSMAGGWLSQAAGKCARTYAGALTLRIMIHARAKTSSMLTPSS